MTASVQYEAPGLTDIYPQVQQFYARHMQLLDDGRLEEWAATFTEDGTFSVPNYPEPARGRTQLVAGARTAHSAMEEAGERRRHWHGMVAVDMREDGTLAVRCYALVFHTPRGGAPRLHRTCVCNDVLVWVGDELQVRERVVTRDDL